MVFAVAVVVVVVVVQLSSALVLCGCGNGRRAVRLNPRLVALRPPSRDGRCAVLPTAAGGAMATEARDSSVLAAAVATAAVGRFWRNLAKTFAAVVGRSEPVLGCSGLLGWGNWWQDS